MSVYTNNTVFDPSALDNNSEFASEGRAQAAHELGNSDPSFSQILRSLVLPH